MSTPGTINFPTSLDDAVSLFSATNNASTTLSGSIGASDLSIAVTSGALLPSSGAVTLVDSITSAPTKIEHVIYTANSSNTLTVPTGGRGFGGSTAQSWSGTVYVRARVLANHHETLRAAIIATETKLGTGSSTSTASTVLLGNGTGTSAWGALTNAYVDSAAAIAYSKLAALTASRALVSDVSGVVSASAVSAAELGYLSGVTSAIQTQLDAKGNAQTANPLSQFAATTSSQLAGIISDETGSGALVFAVSPSLTTPTLGVATATSINKVAFTAPATGATLTLADGSTLATSGANSITLTSTGATNVTLPTSGTLATTASVNNPSPSFVTLTDGATITWAFTSPQLVGNATVTLGGNRALSITGASSGTNGVLKIVQDGTGSRTLTLPAGSKVINGGGGSVNLSTSAGAIDILSFIYDGTNYFWTLGTSYT